jgi:RNA polymerase sigma-70 factor (ECF subfamily)
VHKQKEQAVFADLTDDTEQKTKDEQLDELHRYINEHMPELTQKIFCLRYQQGQKYREIADTLRISEVTVHRHLSQSLEQLKEHFKSLGYGIK